MLRCKVNKNNSMTDIEFKIYDDIKRYPDFDDIVYLDMSVPLKSKEKLTKIPFKLPSRLKTLNIDNHQISEFEDLPETLEFISAKKNRFDNLDWIIRCPNIENVNLYANDCVYIVCDGVPESLREIDLSYNKVKEIHIENVTNDYLRVNLDFNFLKDVPEFILENDKVSGSFYHNDFHNFTETRKITNREANRNRIHMMKRDNPYNNNQNVHHTDINQSVVKSIDRLLNYVKKYNFTPSEI